MKSASLILVFIFVLPLFVKLAVVTNYMIQYERYATELCIYKDIAESSCNGKCQMMKELNQTESNSPRAPQLPEFKLKEQPLNFLSKLQSNKHHFINLRTWVDIDSPKLHTGSIKGVFHPPCC